eukprot:g2415.t1
MLGSFAQQPSALAELPTLGKVGGAFDRQVFLMRCDEEAAACNRPATPCLLTGMLPAARKAGDTEWARKAAVYARANPGWSNVEAMLLALARAGAFEANLIVPLLRAGAHLQQEADKDGTELKDDKWASEALVAKIAMRHACCASERVRGSSGSAAYRLEICRKAASDNKSAGSSLFKKGEYAAAAVEYRKGLSQLRSIRGALGPEADALCVALNTNAAICFVKTAQWEDAIGCASKALKVDPGASKALFQRAKAYQSSQHRPNGLQLARADLRAALKLDPASKPVRAELKRVQQKLGGATGAKKVAAAVEKGFFGDAESGTRLYAEDEGKRRAAREREAHAREQAAIRAAAAQEEAARRADPAAVKAAEEVMQARAAEAKRLAEAEAAAEAEAEAHAAAQAGEAGDAAGDAAVIDAALLGYRVRPDGKKIVSWARDDAATAEDKRVLSSQDFAPRRIANAPAAAAAAAGDGDGDGEQGADTSAAGPAAPLSHNAGYAETNMSQWCAGALCEMLPPMRLRLRGVAAGAEDVEGTVRFDAPSSVRGEAVITTLRGQLNHIFDFSLTIPWQAEIGAAITREVQVKGEEKSMHLGYPTYRGALTLRDVAHNTLEEGGDGVVFGMEWGTNRPDGATRERLLALLEGEEGGPRARLRQGVARFAAHYRNVAGIRAAAGVAKPPLAPLPPAPEPWEWVVAAAEAAAEPEEGGAETSGADASAGAGRKGANNVEGEGAAGGKASLPPALRAKMQELRKAGYAVFS